MIWGMWVTPDGSVDIWLVSDANLDVMLNAIHTRYDDVILFEAELVVR